MIQFAGSPLIEDSAGIADRASDRAFCILNRAAYGYPGYQRFFSRAAGIFGVG